MPGRPPDPVRRQQLLDAVADELVTSGIPTNSLRRLAERVGVAPNTLEHHFGSKQQLFAEALAVLRAREVGRVASAVDDIIDGVDASGALAMAWVALSDHQALGASCVLFEIWGLALRHRDAHRDFLDHVVEDWLSFAQTLLAGAGVPGHRIEALATLVVAAIRGLLLDLLTSGDAARPRIEAGIAELRSLIEHASAGPLP